MTQSLLWVEEHNETHVSIRLHGSFDVVHIEYRRYASTKILLTIPYRHHQLLGYAQEYKLLKQKVAERLGTDRIEIRTEDKPATEGRDELPKRSDQSYHDSDDRFW